LNSKGNTILWAIVACLLWSTAYAGIKIGLQYDTPFHFAGIRFIISGLMILAGNVATAVSNVIISIRSRDIDPLVLSSSSLFFGGVILFLMSVPFESRPIAPYTMNYCIALAWLSFMAATAFSIWYKLLQRPGVKVPELNLWKFITPVTGAALSWLLVPDEHPEWLTISGMLIITISLILFFRNTHEIPVN